MDCADLKIAFLAGTHSSPSDASTFPSSSCFLKHMAYSAGTSIVFAKDALVKEQLRLVQHQIAQLYEAVAIAKKLGRVVILPPFFCGLDRAWFPHRGKFPGSMLSLPYICPGDHVMAMESNKAFTDEYREYTFLGHPQMPEGEVVAANVRRVEVPPSASPSSRGSSS